VDQKPGGSAIVVPAVAVLRGALSGCATGLIVLVGAATLGALYVRFAAVGRR